MKKYIRKADIILFIFLVVIGLAASFYLSMNKAGGSSVIIERNGELYGTYSLFEDREIVISDSSRNASKSKENTIVIKDGTVYMKSASCHNQVCVHHEKISKSGESIVCLPNKLVVKIEAEGGAYDTISR